MPDRNTPTYLVTDGETWTDQLNTNFDDDAIEITGIVDEEADLPTPDGTTSSNGQERTYIVRDDAVIVRDDGSSWVTIAGIGSSSNPLPALSIDQAAVGNAPSNSTDVARKQEVDAKADQTAFADHSARHESGGADTVSHDNLPSRTHSGDSLSPSTVDNDDYHETVVTQSGSTGSLDLSAANVFEQTVTGNITFSFDNPNADPAGNSFMLIVIQDGTGGHTISWPSSVEWADGSAPGVSTAANDKHIFSFVSPDGGTTWYGFPAAENVA